MENDTRAVEIKETKEKDHGFGIYTLRCLYKLLKIFFSKTVCVTFLILICLMALLEQYLVYNIGILPSGFYKVLGDKNLNAFWIQILKSVLLILAICSVISCKKYIINVFYVSSREILTDRLHTLYFNNNRFYYLNTVRYSSADNPDQRITQDVDKFCNQFSSVINPFVIAPFTISYYSYNCYQMTGWSGPFSAFLIFLITAAINKFLMKPIVKRVMLQEKREGYFRYQHMHVRSHAESIAFQDANFAEMSRADSKLFKLVRTQQSLYLREFPLNFAVNVFSYIGSIISYLLLAYPIFSGEYDNLSSPDLSQLISKNAFVSIYLISCFSSLINVSSTISEIGGLAHRVCEILDIMNTSERLEEHDSVQDSQFKLKTAFYSGDTSSPLFELQDITISPPNENKILVANLSLQINFGSNLLIAGKSSAGKTSIFRVIKGLWPSQSGNIIRRMPFVPSVVFFLPQRPLLTDGSLLEQIVYPLEIPKFARLMEQDRNIILRFLKFVELQHIVEKAGLDSDVDWNWYDVLSPGEAQRLSFVRLFYHRPKLAFVDEATGALGTEMEEKLYTKCKELSITMVSIGHRESLLQYHDQILRLDGEGGWTLSPVDISNL